MYLTSKAGVATVHATVFPDGPGLGASWDKDLLHKVDKELIYIYI